MSGISYVCEELLPHQITHCQNLIESLLAHDCVLDVSDTGTGKTYTALIVSKILELKPIIICPLSVKVAWARVCEELDIPEPFITNYEQLRGTNVPFITKKEQSKTRKPKYEWDPSISDDHIIIWDEAHRIRKASSIIGRIALNCTVKKKMFLSATLAETAEHYQVFGVFLKLFRRGGFSQWSQENGAQLGHYGMEYSTSPYYISKILNQIRKPPIPKISSMKISSVEDMPGLRLKIDFLDLPNDVRAKISESFDEILLDLFYKRQNAIRLQRSLAELIHNLHIIETNKIPYIIDVANGYLKSGHSVIIFVSFRSSLDLFIEHTSKEFKYGCIYGGQKIDERQETIDSFQSNDIRLLFCMIQAGSVGISLHDLHGGFPRVILIQPSFNAIDFLQSIGRTYRTKTKSSPIVSLVVAKNTKEEKVAKILVSKIASIQNLNTNKDLDYFLDSLVSNLI